MKNNKRPLSVNRLNFKPSSRFHFEHGMKGFYKKYPHFMFALNSYNKRNNELIDDNN